jgi:hypothetical protein
MGTPPEPAFGSPREGRLDRLIVRSLVSGASPPGKGYLLLEGQESAPPDLRQIVSEELRSLQLLQPLTGGTSSSLFVWYATLVTAIMLTFVGRRL